MLFSSAQFHWNSEYSGVKAQSKFMQNSWVAAKVSFSWKAEQLFPRGSSLGLHRCVTGRWAMGWAAAPSPMNGQYEISWLDFPLTAEAEELLSRRYNGIGRSVAPLFSSPVKVQRSIGTLATRNQLFWPNKQHRLNTQNTSLRQHWSWKIRRPL